MNFQSHLSFGIFTGLLTYFVTGNQTASLIIVFVQIALILDFIFKKTISFEPLHSVLAMLLAWLVSFLFFPQYQWYVLFAYASHLILDIFVYEEIPLLFPSTKQLMYPIEGSEKFVTLLSTFGSVILLGLILL